MKTMKRFLAIVLCLCMAMALLPTAAFAAGESGIQLGTGGIVAGDAVYFGKYSAGGKTYEVPWYALDTNGSLLSKYTLGDSSFQSSGSGYYSGSNLQTTMDELYNGSGTTLFSDLEQGAIKETTLAGDSMYSWQTDLTGQKLFPLSLNEAGNDGLGDTKLRAPSITAPEGSAGRWWLRTSLDSSYVLCAGGDSSNDYLNVVDACGVRPAFNLDLSSVLFTSAAAGGKKGGSLGTLAAVSDAAAVTEWKLTLLDKSRSFAAGTTAYDSTNKILTVAYSGATVGTNEYISAIIKDASGKLKYYGRVAQPASASGTLDIDLSGVTMAATDTLYVFSEQYNGDKKTDYASETKDVALTKNAYAITNTLTNITSSNASTYRLTNDTAAYTATLSADTGYLLPDTITVTGANDYTYSSATGALSIASADITGDITITATGVAKTYSISVAPTSLDFGSVYTGYAAPTAQTVTITNTGNSPVTLTQPTSTNYGLDTLSKTTLGAGETATFLVSPKTGLSAGTYSETITVSGSNSTGTTVDLSFAVRASGGGSTTDYYTLTFNTNGGGELPALTREEHTTIDLTKYTPTREGYTFTGWYSDATLTTKITSIRLTRNATIYAGWEKTYVTPDIGAWDNPFTDVSESDWFYEDVALCNLLDLMQGTSDTTFSPYVTTTRGMIVTNLWRLEGEPVVDYAMTFEDVPANRYYTEAVRWAASEGIVGGYSSDRFGQEDAVTREQLATILYRYEQYKGGGFVGSWYFPMDYPDAAEISAWADEAMHWCVMNGIIQGNAGNLMPKDGATRAQAAAMLVRFLNAVDK